MVSNPVKACIFQASLLCNIHTYEEQYILKCLSAQFKRVSHILSTVRNVNKFDTCTSH